MIRAARSRLRLPELDAATVPRAAQLGVALSVLAIAGLIALAVALVIGLGQKADRADVRALSAESRSARAEAQSSAIQVSVCRLAYVQRPNAPGIAAPSTKRGSDVAPYWQDVFNAIACDKVPRLVLERPPDLTGSAPPTPTLPTPDERGPR